MSKEIIDVMVSGGKATAAPPIGPALSPLKVNVQDIVKTINEKTKAFEGMDVPVKIIVDIDTKKFDISVGTPPVTAMIKKEMKVQKLASVKEGKKELPGDISLESVKKIADSKESISGNKKARVKQVLGTCLSGGVTVDGKSPKELIKDIDEGRIKVE
ncbi:MAG TPA: 50S ribosomal protein L11 [archaeon]|nr:50S ribosomal protein L11 [archaeon]